MLPSKNGSAYGAATVGSRMRLYEVTKSAATTGVPSLYLPSDRRWKVHVRPSGETSQLEAAAPVTSDRSALGLRRASNMMRPTLASYTHCCWVGSSVEGSVPKLTRMICLSAGAGTALVPPELLLPHAAATQSPAVA